MRYDSVTQTHKNIFYVYVFKKEMKQNNLQRNPEKIKIIDDDNEK